MASLSKTNLGNNGYTLVLEQALDDLTSFNHITTLASYCSASTILCFAGGVSYSDTLLTIACGNCLQITSQTTLNSPVFYGGAYWYFTNGYSIGYSPTSAIRWMVLVIKGYLIIWMALVVVIESGTILIIIQNLLNIFISNTVFILLNFFTLRD